MDGLLYDKIKLRYFKQSYKGHQEYLPDIGMFASAPLRHNVGLAFLGAVSYSVCSMLQKMDLNAKRDQAPDLKP